MNFILNWLINYCLIMFAMSVDNIFWIPTSPEYENIKKKKYPVIVEGKKYYNLIDYVFRYRVKSVLTHWRDIVPALITSTILTIVQRLLI